MSTLEKWLIMTDFNRQLPSAPFIAQRFEFTLLYRPITGVAGYMLTTQDRLSSVSRVWYSLVKALSTVASNAVGRPVGRSNARLRALKAINFWRNQCPEKLLTDKGGIRGRKGCSR
ncbi:unnamed protein product [Haemonchus placei]|uniref:Transposase n=1 Tax=Haemonchus placei TaxID=6290 RepID=A0A0N4VWE8_HAEPC|nr:unnamed protein product [Haemonchus placei]